MVVASGTVLTGTVGTYVLTYDYTDANGNVASIVTRTVNVVDTTDPIITLNGSGTITLEVGDTYTENGAERSDNYDGT